MSKIGFSARDDPKRNIFRDHFERPSENCQYQADIKCLGERMDGHVKTVEIVSRVS